MSRERTTTAQKKNAYPIRWQISQSIFREFIVAQGNEVIKNTAVSRFDRPMLSCLADIATRAIMNEPRLGVVLKKQG